MPYVVVATAIQGDAKRTEGHGTEPRQKIIGAHGVLPASQRVGDRTRTGDIQIHSLTIAGLNCNSSNTSDNPPGKVAPQLAPKSADLPKTDPELQRVMAAWPELPDAIKRAILALVETAGRA